MPVTLINPYLTLAELKDELKIPQSDVSKDDTLNTAINLASRWVDEYRGRDYYGHDHRGEAGIGSVPGFPGSAPLTFDKFSDKAYDETLFIPFGEPREIYELKENGQTLTKGTHFTFREPPLVRERKIWRLGTKWQVGEPPTNIISIKGKFGGNQWKAMAPSIVSTPSPSNGIQTMVFTNTNASKNNDKVYVRITQSGPTVLGINVYSDAGLTQPIANPSDVVAPPGTFPLYEVGGSGWSGNITIGTFIGNLTAVVQLRADWLDSASVPTDLPPVINLAAKLVAAAISGHNRKEVAGLDGQRLEIHDNKIPKTVFDLLGRRLPVIL